ncbi:hypothetical protein ACTVWX_04480 [Pseudomonas aeruginosa]
MSEMEKLAAMLSQKKLQQEQVKEDAENQYQQWVESLKRLCRDMEEWLQPLVSSGVASVAITTVQKSERPSDDLAGSYDAPILVVTINGKRLSVDSVGRYVLGCQGAVIVKGVSKEVGLVRFVEDGFDRWKIRSTTNGGRSIKHHELNSDNFAKLLQDFLH